ncbi:hypothetical protein ACJZ2D_011947 [Fusarium nematophilum]
MSAITYETQGVRIAVEGCGHGTLNAIYASIAESCKHRGWDGVDLLIIGGDFQSVRNAEDLSIMSCPVKYRHLGDFPKYYSGELKAPYLTVFIAGNHEASSHLWELYYGGWVAPNIYYLGAANVLRLGPLRIAGLSGIWKGFDYRKPHHERLPFSQDDVKSWYHVREFDVRKLLQVRTQVDVGLSHDWPRAIEKHGDQEWLFKKKPDFRQESRDGTLGNVAAEYVMDRLRPPYWFSAHLHVKFSAVKTYDDGETSDPAKSRQEVAAGGVALGAAPAPEGNPDEIDLDLDEEEVEEAKPKPKENETKEREEVMEASNVVSDDLRAQLPASFARPQPKKTPGQPVPPGITNKEVRFLALDKCLPGRHFLQLCEIQPFKPDASSDCPPAQEPPRYRLQYDPEWLAITRVFHDSLIVGDRNAQTPPDLGEEHYLPLIEAEKKWVEENIVKADKLNVPDNFGITAPPYVPGTPEIVEGQPEEYTNPQTVAFCELLGISNLWDASEEERHERRAQGPPESGRRDSNTRHPPQFAYDPLPSPSCIRLLRRAGRDASGTLRFTIQAFDIENEDVRYHCLSYTWGNPYANGVYSSPHFNSVNALYQPQHLVPVLVNEKTLHIQKNLYDALDNIPDTAYVDELSLGRELGATFLHWEAEKGDSALVELYVKRGANVNVKDDCGRLPLHYAAMRGHINCLDILCRAGSLRSTEDNKGLTAMDLARSAGHEAAVLLLEGLEKGVDPGPQTIPKDSLADELIWADAICINQNDIDEKSAQVCIMDRIYSKATFVLAWLGPEDAETEAGLKTLKILAENIDKFQESQVVPFGGHDKDSYETSGIPFISWNDWVALASIFHRQWFRRAWIVQEAVLPQMLIMYCGKQKVSWYHLGTVAECLRRSEAKLGTTGSKSFVPHDQVGVPVEWNMAEIYKWRTFMRAAQGADQLQSQKYRAEFRLEELIHCFWTFHATEPKDKVFSLYGLMNVFSESRLETDYRRSLARIYTGAARQIMSEAGNLSVLSSCIASKRRQPGLPSWVPDFSLPGINAIPDLFKADKGLTLQLPSTLRDNIDPPRLKVSGIRLGKISQVGTRSGTGHGDKFSFNPSWLKMALSLKLEWQDEELISSILWRTLCMDMSYGSFYDAKKFGPRAPADFGHQFKILMLLMVLSRADGLVAKNAGIEDNFQAGKLPIVEASYDPFEDMASTLDDLDVIARNDGDGCCTPTREEVLVLWDSIQYTLSRLTPASVDGSPRDIYLPPSVMDGKARVIGSGKVVITTKLFERCQSFATAYNIAYGERHLFTLGERYLGLGPVSSEVGDEVWVLPGLSTPAVLRRVEEAQALEEVMEEMSLGDRALRRSQFRFMGAAYVHGVMGGEAVQGREQDLEDIELL